MKTLIRAAAFTLLTLPAFAQDTTALAREYVELPAVQEMMKDMFSPEMLSTQFKATLPPHVSLTDDQIARIGTLMSGEMMALRPQMEKLMVTASAETFTAAELEAMIAFYTSEHGATIMKKMQPFMTSIMADLGPEMLSMQQRITPELIKIIQESAN